jgi:hypothetical protein
MRIVISPMISTFCVSAHERRCDFHILRARGHSRHRDMEQFRPNQPMKPTAPLRGDFSVSATDPARRLSLSR